MHRAVLPLQRAAAVTRVARRVALPLPAAAAALPAAALHSYAPLAAHASHPIAAAAAAAAAAASPAKQPSPAAVAASMGGVAITPVSRMKPTKRGWHLFDARDQVVGRLAARIAALLMGKHRPDYTPHLDHGDAVVVLNAKHIKFTGSKWSKKLYRYHTGYAGGLKEIPAERWRESHPDRILRHAVAGMIKKNKLKVPRLARLKIYPGVVHPHAAQFPFDVVARVPHLKQQRDAELAELAARKDTDRALLRLASSGGKVQPPKRSDAAADKSQAHIQGADDGTMPNDPDIKKAIIKDREQRKGRPIVML